MIPVVNHNFKIQSKLEMIRFHLIVKFFEMKHHPEESALDVLVHLHDVGGISSKEENDSFIDYCVKNKLRGSAQSVRNVLSMYTELGLLVKPKNCIRHFKEPLLPELPEIFVLSYCITNLINAEQVK